MEIFLKLFFRIFFYIVMVLYIYNGQTGKLQKQAQRIHNCDCMEFWLLNESSGDSTGGSSGKSSGGSSGDSTGGSSGESLEELVRKPVTTNPLVDTSSNKINERGENSCGSSAEGSASASERNEQRHKKKRKPQEADVAQEQGCWERNQRHALLQVAATAFPRLMAESTVCDVFASKDYVTFPVTNTEGYTFVLAIHKENMITNWAPPKKGNLTIAKYKALCAGAKSDPIWHVVDMFQGTTYIENTHAFTPASAVMILMGLQKCDSKSLNQHSCDVEKVIGPMVKAWSSVAMMQTPKLKGIKPKEQVNAWVQVMNLKMEPIRFVFGGFYIILRNGDKFCLKDVFPSIEELEEIAEWDHETIQLLARKAEEVLKSIEDMVKPRTPLPHPNSNAFE